MYAYDASILHGKVVPARGAVRRPGTDRPSVTAAAALPHPSLLGRLFHRSEPTVYQRCLAIHVHFAGNNGGMH